MRAVITVIGSDRIGIIAEVSKILANQRVNILDISQTIMQDIFTMFMMVDLTEMNTDYADLSDQLEGKGKEMGLSIKIQREDTFTAMHRI